MSTTGSKRTVPEGVRQHVSQGILTKLDDANVNAPEWLNSFVVVKKPNGKLHICLDRPQHQQTSIHT